MIWNLLLPGLRHRLPRTPSALGTTVTSYHRKDKLGCVGSWAAPSIGMKVTWFPVPPLPLTPCVFWGKACSFSIRRDLDAVSSLRELEKWLREFLRYCLGWREKRSWTLWFSTPAVQPRNSLSQGGGPICSVYTPGPGAKGGFQGGSLTICGIIPASKQRAAGKPSKKYQKPSALSVIT